MLSRLFGSSDRQALRSIITAGLLVTSAACNLSRGLPEQVASEQARTTRTAATVEFLLTASRGSASPLASRPTGTASHTPASPDEPEPPQSACRAGASFIDDVTVNDGTLMEPGESFVKVWRLRNSGDCVWSPEYALVFFGGNRLGASQSTPLSTRVQPGQTADIALEMVAPSEPGTYQGYWKLQTPAGRFFGIGPNADQSFWVKIHVASPVTPTPATPTPSPTRTATPTPSATPYVEGTATLSAGDSIDLDTGTVGTSAQSDLRLELSAADGHTVSPIQGARLAAHSPAQLEPSQSACTGATTTSGSVPLADLSVGDHLCYQTGAGRFGFVKLEMIGPPIAFRYFTFAP